MASVNEVPLADNTPPGFSLVPAIFVPFNGIPSDATQPSTRDEKLMRILENLDKQHDAVKRQMVFLVGLQKAKIESEARRAIQDIELETDDHDGDEIIGEAIDPVPESPRPPVGEDFKGRFFRATSALVGSDDGYLWIWPGNVVEVLRAVDRETHYALNLVSKRVGLISVHTIRSFEPISPPETINKPPDHLVGETFSAVYPVHRKGKTGLGIRVGEDFEVLKPADGQRYYALNKTTGRVGIIPLQVIVDGSSACNGKIFFASYRVKPTISFSLDIGSGDEVEVLKFVSGKIWYGRNHTTGISGTISEDVVADGKSISSTPARNIEAIPRNPEQQEEEKSHDSTREQQTGKALQPEENSEVDELLRNLRYPSMPGGDISEYLYKDGDLATAKATDANKDTDVVMGGTGPRPSRKARVQAIREEKTRKMWELIDTAAKEMDNYDAHAKSTSGFYRAALDRGRGSSSAGSGLGAGLGGARGIPQALERVLADQEELMRRGSLDPNALTGVFARNEVDVTRDPRRRKSLD